MADPIPLLNLVPNEPVSDIVAELKYLLEKAQAGELQAIAVVTRSRDGTFDTWWCKGSFRDFGLAAGIHRLDWRYQQEGFSAGQIVDGPDDGA